MGLLSKSINYIKSKNFSSQAGNLIFLVLVILLVMQQKELFLISFMSLLFVLFSFATGKLYSWQLKHLGNQYFKGGMGKAKLFNKNVVIMYHYKRNKLTIKSLSDTNQKFFIYHRGNKHSPLSIFVSTADIFNSDTSYDSLLHAFCNQGIKITPSGLKRKSDNKKKNKENIQPIQENIQPIQKNVQPEEDIPIIDINLAVEEELTLLSGINTVQAKKAIKYRDEHSGFKSKEEFYEAVKIKSHFIEKMEDRIVVGKYLSEKDIKLYTEGREVDF